MKGIAKFLYSILIICCCTLPGVSAQKPAHVNDHKPTFKVKMPFEDSGSLRKLIEETGTWHHTYPDSAITVYLTVIERSKEANYMEGIRDALQPLGALFASKGMYETSMRFFTEMHEYCKRSISLWPCLPVIYNAIATLHHTQGSYKQAANFYYQSVTLNERLRLPPPAGGYNNLAAVLMTLGQYDEALHYLDLAESYALKHPRHPLLGSINNNKGQVWLTRHDWAKSATYFKRALAIGLEHNLPQVTYTATTNMGTWHLWQKQYKKALKWYFSDEGQQEYIDPIYISARDQHIGNCYLELKNYRLAERYFLRALSIAQTLDLKKREMELHHYLGAVYEAKQEYTMALFHHKVHTQFRDSIANLEIIDNAQQLNIKFRTAEKDKKIALNEQQISMQEVNLKKKNLWIGGVTGGILLLGGALVVIVRSNHQRQKLHERQLHILQQQQQIERLNALMQGEEQERTRIARDLHDGIGGMLAAVKMNFTTLQHEYEQYAQAYHFIKTEDLYKIREMLDRTGDEVRKTAHNLMPDILVQHGFHAALKVYCDHINAGNQLYVNLQVSGSIDEVLPSFQLALYRIIQELVQNVLKHSDASNALLQISHTNETITIMVKDNGRGFNTGNIPAGIGLKNIRSRTQALHGSFTLSAAIGSGTRVDIVFDLKETSKSPLYENTDSYSG